MTPRHRYRVAFFALGWLIIIGLLFRMGMGSGFQAVYSRISDRLGRVTQFFSDVEGNAVQRARKTSRREYLEPLAPVLSSVNELKNPQNVLLGAYDGALPNSFAGFNELEERLRIRFPIISFYTAWGDKPEQQFPTRMVETIDRLGSVPLITWEPWVTDFDESVRKNLPSRQEREYASLAAIARGDYDFYIVPWAQNAAKYGKPLFLRFAHEMNDPYRYPWGPQNGNRPEDFIAAWRHVHVVFQKMGATNVLWIWSPHISMPWFEFYYPGPEYVDWIGLGILNYGNVASWSRWWSFHQILEKSYKALADLHKPLIISEFGTLQSGGDMTEWYRQSFYHLDHSYGRIRAIVFFNQTADVTMSQAPLNWSVLQNEKATELVAEELARKSQL
jgi:hypothetical protein